MKKTNKKSWSNKLSNYQFSCCSVFQTINYRQPSFSGCRR